MEYADIRQACEILGIKEKASLKEIKQRYRKLVRQHHPDRNASVDSEQIRFINAAYAVLEKYCSEYTFSFSKDEFFAQNPEARLREQFAYDPVWGGAQPSEDD
ncbi:MAG: DnaJ domain-containing protein [Desulfuromonadaceae bacterium]|nr:DnaJ domain-containing protein [Desulfuromonas sp.]MDY0186134.1 DnaJ domain-containing protein [Desulfuromonadaceae bacterium]MDY0213546.1 DnaJ domain-containing protein [Desulfuromonadaceae bacterium]